MQRYHDKGSCIRLFFNISRHSAKKVSVTVKIIGLLTGCDYEPSIVLMRSMSSRHIRPL